MVMCFAPTCKHYSEKDTCKYFVFPSDPSEFKRWLKLIRRKDREPGKHARICSCHFVDGDRKNGPTLYDYNVGKQFDPAQTIYKRKKILDENEAGPSGLQQIEAEILEEPMEEITDAPEQAVPQQFPAMTEAENYFLQQEVATLKEELKKKTAFCYDQIKDNDHLIRVYTGLPTKDIFLSLFNLFENLKLNYFRGWQVIRVSRIDQLLLTLMKLKLNLLNDDLGLRFNISRETVANIFKTWLFALHEILYLQLMQEIPSKEKNKLCMPTSFSSFTNCRIIIDCTEVSTIRAENMEKQRLTYSSYKHKNTLKALVGVAPNGVVTYVSNLYPGSTSDKKITEHCGVLQKLVSGDLVLADKGFLISDILPQGVSINVPPFLSTPQFNEEQIIRTRTIARARIHVERAINRIKMYTILSMIPATLTEHASIIFKVCAALTNLHFPLIREVENLYDQ